MQLLIVRKVWQIHLVGEFTVVFLGAMLAILSLTIIVKALEEPGMRSERFAQLIFGILMVEDIPAIAWASRRSANSRSSLRHCS